MLLNLGFYAASENAKKTDKEDLCFHMATVLTPPRPSPWSGGRRRTLIVNIFVSNHIYYLPSRLAEDNISLLAEHPPPLQGEGGVGSVTTKIINVPLNQASTHLINFGCSYYLQQSSC